MFKAQVDYLEGRVHTVDYRIYCALHPTVGVGVAEHMNRNDRAVLPVTDAMVYGKGFQHPPGFEELGSSLSFMVIPKDRILWIKGGYFDKKDAHQYEVKRVIIFFADHFLLGDLRMTKDSRISDYLNSVIAQRPFHRLYNASLGVLAEGEPVTKIKPLERFDLLTVNLANITGMGEPQGFDPLRLEDPDAET